MQRVAALEWMEFEMEEAVEKVGCRVDVHRKMGLMRTENQIEFQEHLDEI